MDGFRILFTGGSGLLGRMMRGLWPNANFPPRRYFDVTNLSMMEHYMRLHDDSFATVVHAAAFTSPPKVDKDPLAAMEANVVGTANVVSLCMARGIRLVYVSTDYVFRGDAGDYREDDETYPTNKYAWSKLGGECAVRMYDNSLIVRTSFGPDEFPYEGAFVDQFTSRLPVSEFAKRLAKVVSSDVTGVLHVGGPRRTVYDYASSLTDKPLKRLSIDDMPTRMPRDTSLYTDRYDRLFPEEGDE